MKMYLTENEKINFREFKKNNTIIMNMMMKKGGVKGLKIVGKKSSSGWKKYTKFI